MDREPTLYLRLIGCFKIFCAVLMIAVSLGLIHLLGQDMEVMVQHWIKQLNLDPKDKHINAALENISNITKLQLIVIDVGAFLYGTLYMIEGVGLVRGKAWAEYLTIVATSLFIPLEIFELLKNATAVKFAIFAVNVLIVVYLVYQVRQNKRR